MRVCVFCGAASGQDARFAHAARRLGFLLGAGDMCLVYGGARTGLMGIVADSMLAAGGEAIGVLPRSLILHEIGHDGLSRLELVENMSQRKARMMELADAFIVLPGGAGTLDELFEVLTLSKLELHRKPCVIINIAGYYDLLIAFLENAGAQAFISPAQRAALAIAGSPEAAIEMVAPSRVQALTTGE